MPPLYDVVLAHSAYARLAYCNKLTATDGGMCIFFKSIDKWTSYRSGSKVFSLRVDISFLFGDACTTVSHETCGRVDGQTNSDEVDGR